MPEPRMTSTLFPALAAAAMARSCRPVARRCPERNNEPAPAPHPAEDVARRDDKID